MSDFRPHLGLYSHSGYNSINISNFNYAKYSKSSLDSYRPTVTPRNSSSIHVATNQLPKPLIQDDSNDIGDKSSLSLKDGSVTSSSGLSKKYQKYRSLILKKSNTNFLPKSTNSTTNNNNTQLSITFTSLPDEIIQLVFSFVSSEKSYCKTPYNPDAFLGQNELSSSPSKRSYNVSFILSPADTNVSPLINIGPNTQLKVKRPREDAGLKSHAKYLKQVLRNFKLSSRYQSSPKRNTLNLLYLNKRLYRLALPFVYRNIKFHSSYRFAQFISSIRRNNNLGLLPETIELHDIDTLYYIVIDISDSDSYLIITEAEKNQIEQLMNNPELYFDGTFPSSIDWSRIPASRINPNEVLNSNSRRLPICIIKDEHSIVTSHGDRADFGFHEKVILAGWREWKFRADPLYHTTTPTVDWAASRMNRATNISSASMVTSSASNTIRRVGLMGTVITSETRLSRLSSVSSVFSNYSSSGSSESRSSFQIRSKFRKIIRRFSGSKRQEDEVLKENTKANRLLGSHTRSHSMSDVLGSSSTLSKSRLRSKSVTIGLSGNSNSGIISSTLKESPASSNVFKTFAGCQSPTYLHPMKCKLLTKYTTKDLPIGAILHILVICGNLKVFDMSKVMLASDYIISYDAFDDYGILRDISTKVPKTRAIVKNLSASNSSTGPDSFANDPHYPSPTTERIRRASFESDKNDRRRSFSEFNSGNYRKDNLSSLSVDMAPICKTKSNNDVKTSLYATSTYSNSGNFHSGAAVKSSQPPYSSILKEIDQAYGVSIYSQFNSVVNGQRFSPKILYRAGGEIIAENSTSTGTVVTTSTDINRTVSSSKLHSAELLMTDDFEYTTNSGSGSSSSNTNVASLLNTMPKDTSLPLDFYKDSFGYSSNCNYKLIQSRFYREFWGVPSGSTSKLTYNSSTYNNTGSGAFGEDLSVSGLYVNNNAEYVNGNFNKVVSSDPKHSTIIENSGTQVGDYMTDVTQSSRSKSPTFGYHQEKCASGIGNLLLKEESRSVESMVLVLNSAHAGANHERSGLRKELQFSDDKCLESKGKELIRPNPRGNFKIDEPDKKSHLGVDIRTSNTGAVSFRRADITEESEEDEKSELQISSTGTSDYSSSVNYYGKIAPNKSKRPQLVSELSTKLPTMKYFHFKHDPTEALTSCQNDTALYLSDVRKINNWNLEQLVRVLNDSILHSLAQLKNLETVNLGSINWLSTKNVSEFLKTSAAIRFGNLKQVDFRNSGMRRDLDWAIRGSVRELKRSLKDNTKGNGVDVLRIGRNYTRF